MDTIDKTDQAAEVADIMHSGAGTDDRKTVLEPIGNDGAYFNARIACPNCGRVAKVAKIKSDEPKILRNIRCKVCPITGFDWAYKPMEVGGQYVYMDSSASVATADMPRMKAFNEKRNLLSNK
jgi:hypothetical protein